MKKNPNDPFDWSQYIKGQTSFDGTHYEGAYPGLTKLEYFAAIALQGLLANDVLDNLAARDAVKCAKLLIDELNKEQK